MTSEASTFRPPGALAGDPLGRYNGAWSPRLAAHLLRRAGFGGSQADVVRYSRLQLDGAVDALIRFPDTGSLSQAPELIDDEEQRRWQMLSEGMRPGRQTLTDDQRMALRQSRRSQDRANVTWWLNRMLQTPAPLQEKMTLYLHGHFATASSQKGIYGLDIVDQNNLFRRYALGNWRSLTHDVARDRAMLKWLDNAASRKEHPNENFARELMELFTLGIGNYTETDVRESARAFTGYTIDPRSGQFLIVDRFHDDGSKTFLGRTGNFTGDQIIDIIFQQPAAPKYFAHRMLEFFVYTDPEPELVDAFAALIRKNDFNMAPVMSTLFRSNVFYSERTYRALVKSPVEFVVGSYKIFGIQEVPDGAIAALQRMDQVPFHPPSVKGWDGGAQWLNTQTLLARENFASQLMTLPGARPSQGAQMQMMADNGLFDSVPSSVSDAARRLIATILQGDASPKATSDLEGYLNGDGTSALADLSGENFQERMRGAAYLTMAMPAYQLS